MPLILKTEVMAINSKDIEAFLSFLLAQMKELKKTSTPSKASPYIGRMQTENCRNRQFSVGFGKPGHGLEFLSAGAEWKAEDVINSK